MNKFSFEVINEVQLNTDGLSILEIKNDSENTYDYYVYMPGYAFEHAFGITQDNERFSTTKLVRLYEDGYFNGIIELFA